MRILHVDYQQLRKYGHSSVSWAQKLYFGLIRNGHCVHAFSDRDVAAFEAPFGIRELGKNKANRRLLQTIEAFEPELMILGHCDIISNETVLAARQLRPDMTIISCNNDPLFVPENVQKIHHRCAIVDAMFVSTGKKELYIFDGGRARLYHMPNPVDGSIETFDSSAEEDLPTDLIFCSKSTAHTSRGKMAKHIKDNVDPGFNFSTPGSFGQPGVWGRDYDHALAKSKMGLNFNRQEGFHWYSSARMAQLAGNGLLTFTHQGAQFDELFPAESLVYFKDADELLHQIKRFYADNDMRRHWASTARDFFHNEMNSTLYAQYIVETSMHIPASHNYVWAQQ